MKSFADKPSPMYDLKFFAYQTFERGQNSLAQVSPLKVFPFEECTLRVQNIDNFDKSC